MEVMVVALVRRSSLMDGWPVRHDRCGPRGSANAPVSDLARNWHDEDQEDDWGRWSPTFTGPVAAAAEDGGGLENRYRETYRGFESLALRSGSRITLFNKVILGFDWHDLADALDVVRGLASRFAHLRTDGRARVLRLPT
jgi:hypothetical protein